MEERESERKLIPLMKHLIPLHFDVELEDCHLFSDVCVKLQSYLKLEKSKTDIGSKISQLSEEELIISEDDASRNASLFGMNR